MMVHECHGASWATQLFVQELVQSYKKHRSPALMNFLVGNSLVTGGFASQIDSDVETDRWESKHILLHNVSVT